MDLLLKIYLSLEIPVTKIPVCEKVRGTWEQILTIQLLFQSGEGWEREDAALGSHAPINLEMSHNPTLLP